MGDALKGTVVKKWKADKSCSWHHQLVEKNVSTDTKKTESSEGWTTKFQIAKEFGKNNSNQTRIFM